MYGMSVPQYLSSGPPARAGAGVIMMMDDDDDDNGGGGGGGGGDDDDDDDDELATGSRAALDCRRRTARHLEPECLCLPPPPKDP